MSPFLSRVEFTGVNFRLRVCLEPVLMTLAMEVVPPY